MGSFADAVGLMGSVLFHKPGGRAPSELERVWRNELWPLFHLYDLRVKCALNF